MLATDLEMKTLARQYLEAQAEYYAKKCSNIQFVDGALHPPSWEVQAEILDSDDCEGLINSVLKNFNEEDSRDFIFMVLKKSIGYYQRG